MQRNKDSRIQIISQVTVNKDGTQPWSRFLQIFSVKWEGRNVKGARILSQLRMWNRHAFELMVEFEDDEAAIMAKLVEVVDRSVCRERQARTKEKKE